MLKIINGDLFNATETYLCHQCNCVTNRAAHLAQKVFCHYPYSNVYINRTVWSTPGTVSIIGSDYERYVIGMFGQIYPGKPRYPTSTKDGYAIRFEYFKQCLNVMKKKIKVGSFAFPWQIGCGAAGGNWTDYLEALVDFSESAQGDVVIYRLVQ